MIFIDGCHDYEIVSKDWQNISKTMERNSDVVILFDDSTYEGVSVLRREIESSALYKYLPLTSTSLLLCTIPPDSREYCRRNRYFRRDLQRQMLPANPVRFQLHAFAYNLGNFLIESLVRP
jgi:hypothetical protein